MNIRCATIQDVELLVELNAHVQHVHAEALPHMFKPAGVTDALIELFRRWLTAPDNHFLIGEVDGEAVGYVFAKVERRPENTFIYERAYVTVDQISVNTEHRGKGYGKLLMAAVYDLARDEGIDWVMLDVWTFNERAKQFYDELGFSTFRYRMERRL